MGGGVNGNIWVKQEHEAYKCQDMVVGEKKLTVKTQRNVTRYVM